MFSLYLSLSLAVFDDNCLNTMHLLLLLSLLERRAREDLNTEVKSGKLVHWSPWIVSVCSVRFIGKLVFVNFSCFGYSITRTHSLLSLSLSLSPGRLVMSFHAHLSVKLYFLPHSCVRVFFFPARLFHQFLASRSGSSFSF